MKKIESKKFAQGFTLIELLATIVLLGVVLTISILSFSSISKSIREAQKENILSSIKVAAKKYVNDRNVNKVYVETLIKEGFIEADDESQNIYAPDTKESLNCYYVDYTNNKEEFKQGSYNSETGTCNYDLISDAIISMKYCTVAIGGTCANRDYRPITGEWIDAKGKDVYLKVYNVHDFLDGATYKWISPLAPDVHYEGNVYKIEVPAKQFIDDVYQVIAYKNDKPYTAEARIRIDLKSPLVQDVLVSNAQGWATKKTISATLTDNESTLSSYTITQSTSVPTSGWKNISGANNDIAKEIDNNGTWYIWVKDKAGNTNQDTIHHSSIEVDKIDSIAPTCINSGDNDEWTQNNVTITWGCQDDGSGCVLPAVGSETFDTTTKTANIKSYKIKDNVGNETTCPVRTANVYIDKTSPSVSDFKISSTEEYNSKYANITIEGSDDHSGVSKVCVSSSNDFSSCSWKDFNGEYSTSYTFDGDDGSGTSYTLYAFIKDVTGNISDSKKASYTLYKTCDKTYIAGYSNWGDCSKECGGGYYYRDIYYADTYFKTACPTDNDGDKSIDQCNTHSCCDEGEYEYDYCSNKGYKVYTRYNECIEDYESYTSTEGCNSNYYGCSWGSCDDSGWKYKSCKYKNKGREYINTKVDKEACSTDYYDCKWGTCQSDGYRYQTCSYMYGGREYENDEADWELCLDSINADRYVNCDVYHITTCEPITKNNPKCNYNKKNGVSSTGKVNRNSLSTSMPDSCKQEPTAKTCNAYISSVSGSTVTFTITGDCTVDSYTVGSCSKAGKGSNYIKAGYSNISAGSKCGIWVKILGATYTYNDQDYNTISWNTYKCSSSTGRGAGWYCTGNSEAAACKKTNGGCAK